MACLGWVVAQPPDFNKDDAHRKLFYAATGRDPRTSACDGAVLVSQDSGATWTVTKGISGPGKDNPMRVGLGIGLGDFAYAAFADCQNGGGLTQSQNNEIEVWATTQANQLPGNWKAETVTIGCPIDWLLPAPC